MSFMWADTLLSAERALLLRLLAWGALSVLTGTATLAWLRLRGRSSALLEHFAIQMTAWGALELAFVALSWRALAPRDLSGATRLDRLLWLNAGLDVGYVLVGVALAVTGWRLERRLGVVGAGIGVVVQGAALLLLDLILASQISR
ncbi:MAG: DUF6992 family protein [Gemmatimonadaceae bacterium]